ncbi:hypothetical protein GCM10010301_72460 [Streptomyces plicatus]|nr:hypothetical protein GCM10010301_72460 [Streptomyces plicatus]
MPGLHPLMRPVLDRSPQRLRSAPHRGAPFCREAAAHRAGGPGRQGIFRQEQESRLRNLTQLHYASADEGAPGEDCGMAARIAAVASVPGRLPVR